MLQTKISHYHYKATSCTKNLNETTEYLIPQSTFCSSAGNYYQKHLRML